MSCTETKGVLRFAVEVKSKLLSHLKNVYELLHHLEYFNLSFTSRQDIGANSKY